MTEPVLAAALRATCTALELPIEPQQAECLLNYLALLQRWNATYNLTAIRDPAQMLTQHLADCLAVARPLVRQLGSGSLRLLDVGSGGGLPGVVIAIVLPNIEVTCVDAVGKKAAFVRQAAGELQLRNLLALHTRVENLEARPFDVVVSRAFAALDDFVRLTQSLLTDDGLWLAMKGKLPDDEIATVEANASASVFHVEQLVVPGLHADRCLIWLKSTKRSTSPNL